VEKEAGAWPTAGLTNAQALAYETCAVGQLWRTKKKARGDGFNDRHPTSLRNRRPGAPEQVLLTVRTAVAQPLGTTPPSRRSHGSRTDGDQQQWGWPPWLARCWGGGTAAESTRIPTVVGRRRVIADLGQLSVVVDGMESGMAQLAFFIVTVGRYWPGEGALGPPVETMRTQPITKPKARPVRGTGKDGVPVRLFRVMLR